MEKFRNILMFTLTAVFFFSCASSRERQAFKDLADAESIKFVTKADTFTHQHLPELNEHSTLSDYLVYAALNNAGLRSAFNRWKAALERIPQVKSLPDPRFTYAYFIKEVETRVGPQRHKYALTQMFPWFGKLSLKGDVALETANAEKQKYESEKLKLFFAVKDAYYEYYYLARAISTTEEHMKLVRYLESVARTKYKSAISPYGDVIKAQVELGKLEDRLKTLRDLRAPVMAKLNASLNRPFQLSLPWPHSIPEEQVTFSKEELLSWLKKNNPELKSIDALIAREKSAIKLARKSFFPDITLGVEYINTNNALTPPPDPDTGEITKVKDDGKDPVIATFSVNVPIWYGNYLAGEREAKARYFAALNKRADRENNLIANLEMAIYNFRDAERKINLYRDTLIPKAEQSLNVIQQAFAAGKTDFLDVIDAERTLLEFQLSFERALANRAQRLAEIESLLGREIPRAESSVSSNDNKIQIKDNNEEKS